MNHLNMDVSQEISSWYRKDTYLKAYSSFIQPVPNMKMWPGSTNPIVEPPEVRKMPGRPPKNRKKEIGEVRKAGKLPKYGITMTCSICRAANHNKRGCPKNPMPKTKSRPTLECAEPSQQSSNGTKSSRGQYERATTSSKGGGTSTRGRGTSPSSRGAGARSGYKRPRVVGQGVFVAETGYTSINVSVLLHF
ncbi:uncharacterized protein LOC132066662 [Lycium ferocissimum]|uniref:uncharacterized protein LOC132066662 n=1 Tax=Lycium ferocissimum TaxID=112874 RepID=UPI002815A96C|nr:uncharacterized protein LOC132066662 [Lycium ferocissimum]